MLIFILPSFSIFSFFTISHSYVMHMDIYRQRFLRNYLTQDYEIWQKALICQVVLCIKESATYCICIPLFLHFSFSPTKTYVTDFSAPIEASVCRFCIHLEGGQVYCVKENQGANINLAFFFHFLTISHSYVMHMDIFRHRFLRIYLTQHLFNLVQSFCMKSCTV